MELRGELLPEVDLSHENCGPLGGSMEGRMVTLEPPPGLPAGVEPWTTLGLSRSGLARFLKEAQRAVGLRGGVDVLLAGDRRLRRLNREFRGKDKATDVLSFPAAAAFAGEHAGDLAVSLETAARQASEQGHSLRDEVRVLLLHGLLHLSGMDHEADRGEMAAREAELRKRLRLKSGLIARVHDADEAQSRGKRSRFPSGMTTRKAKTKTAAKKRVWR
jgi:probable rRNA maturation factor